MSGDRGQLALRDQIARRLVLLVRTLPGLRSLPWRYRITGTIEAADELPETLVLRTAMLVGAAERANWVAFDCPRHGGERILLNLSFARKPRWSVEDQELLTIAPSIDALHRGSRCHFWIRRGRVKWAKNSMGPTPTKRRRIR